MKPDREPAALRLSDVLAELRAIRAIADDGPGDPAEASQRLEDLLRRIQAQFSVEAAAGGADGGGSQPNRPVT